MPIVPDTKNWTWVLERGCPDCGFDASRVAYDDIASLVHDNVAGWQRVLTRDDVAQRPDDHTWSDLEYAAHVRDVFRIFRTRVLLMTDQDDPAFENWDQDATAEAERYNEQDPSEVASELTAAGRAVAETFASIPPEQRGRTGRRSDGSRFTVESLAQYFIHDPVHHLHDVGASGARAR